MPWNWVFIILILFISACVSDPSKVPSSKYGDQSHNWDFGHGGGRGPKSVPQEPMDKSVTRFVVPTETVGFSVTCWTPSEDRDVRKIFYPLNYPTLKFSLKENAQTKKPILIASDLCASYGKDFLDKNISDSQITALFL